MKRFACCIIAALLVGFAPKYQIAVGTADGYLEDEISPGIYRVHFQFNPAPFFSYVGPTFEQLVLLRAADLTLERGYGYFIVDKTALPGTSRGGQSLVVKLFAEPPHVDGLKVYDALQIASKLRARHSYLRTSGHN